MIRKLTENDRAEIETFVTKDKELNLFMIGDLEKYSFEESFLEYWGQYDNHQLTGVLMRFYEYFTVYADDQVDVKGMLDIMSSYEVKSISGAKRFVDPFESHVDNFKRKDAYYARLNTDKVLVTCDEVVKTAFDDIEEVLKLINDIDEFSGAESLERIQKQYNEGTKTGYHLKEAGKIVSTAETAAENSKSAMIVSVATHKSYRKQGHASKVISKLCRDKLEEGKTLCLFYDNPAAGQIYKQLGFESIDRWTSLLF